MSAPRTGGPSTSGQTVELETDRLEVDSGTLAAARPVQGTSGEESRTVATDKGKGKAKDTGPTARKDAGKDGADASTHKIRKLVPPRPFPTVPTSVSATGPRSAHTDGKNYICITRHTPLGGYLRRCKDVILKDGYKNLHLSAMGAAIPHLMLLTVSLPSILPFPPDEVHTEILTGTVEVQDELIPEDEDEDISYRTRGKSTVSVVIKIGNGVDEVLKGKNKRKGKGGGYQAADTVGAAGGNPGAGRRGKKNGKAGRQNTVGDSGPAPIVVREDEMETV
ncbi:hypothetical protein BKA93DRAFT_725448 [Sparassis latifolia]